MFGFEVTELERNAIAKYVKMCEYIKSSLQCCKVCWVDIF